MAKAKRKTLPKNFRELIEAGDIAALKAVFDACEISAYHGYNKETALHFYRVPEALVRWLIEQGLDVDTPDATYGKTPLYMQASVGSPSMEVLLELGADVNKATKDGDTPLSIAAMGCRVNAVKTLLSHGADVNTENRFRHRTPLAVMLAACNNVNIAHCAQIVPLLLNAGAKITPDMKESVRRIGKDFEFHRERFNQDMLAETEAGLTKLYEIFDVEPVAKRIVHDGVSPIKTPAGTWQEQHRALWQFLVPSQGACKTVQGEVIRLTGRLSHEIMDNGSCNWDAYFRKMCDALLTHLNSLAALTPEELNQASAWVKTIRPKGYGDTEQARLCELAVKWVAQNPQPVALGETDYQR